MIRVGIVDDEKTVLEFLAQKVTEISSELNVEIKIETFLNGKELLNRNKENEFPIIMLDLEMPDMDGLSVARELREEYPDFVLLFITNRSDLVFQSFEYDVTGFIRKSHIDNELKETLDRAYQKVLRKMTSYVLKTEKGERIFPSSSICYFLSKGHQIFLFDDLNQPIRIFSTLEKLEDILSPTSFIRCHSGIIVNCKFIFSINKSDIELINGEILPLSRYRTKEVKQIFQKYLRSM